MQGGDGAGAIIDAVRRDLSGRRTAELKGIRQLLAQAFSQTRSARMIDRADDEKQRWIVVFQADQFPCRLHRSADDHLLDSHFFFSQSARMKK